MADFTLAVRQFGAGPPLLALHGFTLTGAQFAEPAVYLDRSILAPDLPGHGATTFEPGDAATTAALLSSWLAEVGGPMPVLGYSMGGRVALSVALDRPDLVDRVVVVSAGPGILDPATRAHRAAEDAALAERIRTGGLAAFLDAWLSAPMTSTEGVDYPTQKADRAIREENSAEGLAAALLALGQGTFPYLGDRLATLSVPLLAISGGKDERYTEQAAALAAAVPEGNHVVVERAGHNVVLETPKRLASIVAEFLG